MIQSFTDDINYWVIKQGVQNSDENDTFIVFDKAMCGLESEMKS
jgi:hypothetical protein